jgi:hypothetical protein
MTVELFPIDRVDSPRPRSGAHLAERSEGLARAGRVVTSFPSASGIEAHEARSTAMTETLTRLPVGAVLSIRLRLDPDRDGVACAFRLRQPGDEAACERRLEQTLACAFPTASFGTGGAGWGELPFVRAVWPASLEIRPAPRKATSVVALGVIPLGARVVAPAGRTFDLVEALVILQVLGRCELRLKVRAWPVDARLAQELGQLKQKLAAADLALGGATATTDLARMVGDLQGHGGFEVTVSAAFETEPDRATLDLVSFALFGRPTDADGAPTEAFDLRGVWPATWPAPPLLPTTEKLRWLNAGRGRPRLVSPGPGGLCLGEDLGGGPVALSARDRARHLYLIGATGTGKSTMILNFLAQDFAGGEGVILLDPHGDLAEDAVQLARASRRDVIFADAADIDGAFRMNILAGQGGDPAMERNYVVNALIRALSHIIYAGVPEAFGPMFEMYFRNALFLIMEAGASLLDVERVFHDKDYRTSLLVRCADAKVVEFWTRTAPAVTHDDHNLDNIAPYITCKLTQFTGNPLMRRVLASSEGTIDFARVMDTGQVLVLKAAKGVIGQKDAELLCALVAVRIAQAGMARARRGRAERRPARIYIDEFQTCAGDGLVDLLAESRKYGLSLVLANQSLEQVDGGAYRPDTGGAALANAANLVAFRVGAPDAARLAPWFAPDVDWVDLCRQRDFHATARLLQDGAPSAAFTFRTARPPRQVFERV